MNSDGCKKNEIGVIKGVPEHAVLGDQEGPTMGRAW